MTLRPDEYAARFDGPIRDLIAEATRRSPAFAQRLRSTGVGTSEITDIASLDRIPVLSKDELTEQQNKRPPFGGLLADDARVRRIFQSPGPIYEPEEAVADPWRWRAALEAAGFTSDDIVLNAFAYHLSPAGAMFEEAALSLGCAVVPGGIGNMELQARACSDLGVTAYIGLPSYLNSLFTTAEDAGLDPSSWPLEKAFVTAEPLPTSLRETLHRRLSVVRQGYGTAETGNLGYECERMEGLHLPSDALVQICDLTTGEALWDGREGQVVATLFQTHYPMIRLGTGDLSRFLTGPCSCGIETPRIAGWLGRIGEAVKVRGMFLHPRQVEAVMSDVEGIEAYRFLVERAEHKDMLRCEVVAAPNADPDLPARIKDRIRSALRFSVEVHLVESIDEEQGVIVDTRSWK